MSVVANDAVIMLTMSSDVQLLGESCRHSIPTSERKSTKPIKMTKDSDATP